MKTGNIRPGQWMTLLIVSHSAVLLQNCGNTALLPGILCAVIVSAVVFAPAYASATRETDPISNLPPWLRSVLAAGCGLYLLLEGGRTAAELGTFAAASELPGGMEKGILPALGLAALYGAWMGMESAARVAGFGLMAGVAALVGISVLLSGQLDWSRIPPAELTSEETVLQTAGKFVAGLCAEGILLLWGRTHVKQLKPRHGGMALSVVGLEAAGMTLLTGGILGSGGAVQQWPLYAATLAARPEITLRPEGLYTILLILMVYVRVSTLLLGFGLCMRVFSDTWIPKCSLPTGAVLIVVTAFVLQRDVWLTEAIAGMQWIPGLLFAAGVPLLEFAVRKKREPGKAGEGRIP